MAARPRRLSRARAGGAALAAPAYQWRPDPQCRRSRLRRRGKRAARRRPAVRRLRGEEAAARVSPVRWRGAARRPLQPSWLSLPAHRLCPGFGARTRGCGAPALWRKGGAARGAAWLERDRRERIAMLCAGFAVPWLAALIGLAAAGSLAEFFYWTFSVNGYYIANGNTLGSSLRLAVAALRLMFGFAPGAWLVGTARLAHEVVRAEARRPLVVLWALGSLLPIALGGRFFPHYFLQLFPPLVLLASAAAVDAWERLGRWHWRLAGAAAASTLVLAPAASMAAFRDAEALSVPHALPSARQVAAYVREHSSPAARVIFWGYGSALYYLSERRPATRFPYVTYLVGAVEGTPSWWSPFHPSKPLEIARAWDLFFEDLERHPPALFIDTAEAGYFGFYKFPPARYPRLQAYLDAHYRRSDVAGFPVWSREP